MSYRIPADPERETVVLTRWDQAAEAAWGILRIAFFGGITIGILLLTAAAVRDTWRYLAK